MLLSFGLGEERLIENMIDVGHLPFHIWTEISPADNTVYPLQSLQVIREVKVYGRSAIVQCNTSIPYVFELRRVIYLIFSAYQMLCKGYTPKSPSYFHGHSSGLPSRSYVA